MNGIGRLFSLAIVLLALMLSAGSPARAADNGPADPHLRAVNVSGFRLGMSPAAVRAQIHVLDGRITDTQNTVCEADRLQMIRRHELTAESVAYVGPERMHCLRKINAVLANGATTYLTFDEDFRSKPSTMRLVAIAFTFDAVTAAERRTAYQAAIDKFGPPTISYYDSGSGNGNATWLPYTCGWYEDLNGHGRRNPCMGGNDGWLELTFNGQSGHPAIQLYDGETDLAILALRKKNRKRCER